MVQASSQVKSAIVTGGSHGIGFAMSEYLASQGHRVAVLDINADQGKEAVSSLGHAHPKATIIFKKCDVSSWQEQAQAFKEVYDEFGGIDIVAANAGVSEGRSSMYKVEKDSPTKPNTKVLDVNVHGVVYSVKLAVHYLAKNDVEGASRGTIVCTSSDTGLYPMPTNPLYSLSKAGVINLVRSMAPVLGKLAIQINALAPNLIATKDDEVTSEFYKVMSTTPMSTVLRGFAQLVEDPGLTGAVAEASGDEVSLRQPPDYMDGTTQRNFEKYKEMGILALDVSELGSK